MPKVNPFYSPSESVYHNNSACTEGNNIESCNRREGTGGKVLCQHCARLNAEGK